MKINIRINQHFVCLQKTTSFNLYDRFPRLFLSIWCKLADKRTTSFLHADNGVNTVVISTLMTIAGLGTLTGTIFFGFVGDKIV
ncbi:hypothetical protein ECZU18_00300 [Escherichia coli]|nr:hypothetical protein ECZU18_00300 [Escherichia coli]